eukprot:3921795-Rhodomonas_salina.2
MERAGDRGTEGRGAGKEWFTRVLAGGSRGARKLPSVGWHGEHIQALGAGRISWCSCSAERKGCLKEEPPGGKAASG